MKPFAPIVLLLGFCLLAVEPASAQLFRRARSRKAARPCCCCSAPATALACSPAMQVIAPTAGNLAPSVSTPPVAVPRIAPDVLVPAPAAKLEQSPPQVSVDESITSPSDVTTTDEIMAKDEKQWKTLFDGKTLGDWVSTRFGGEGEVRVEDGQISCDFGQYITGVTYKGKDVPKNNYEIELEAMRVDGGDFFCGLTFPVDDNHATFVVGGWGGSVTGISSIDDYDASENDTTDYMQFENKKWYKIRVRVTKGVLEAWINDKKMVSKDIEGARLSTRIEVDPSKPLGIACFDTQAAYRNIRIRTESKPDTKSKK